MEQMNNRSRPPKFRLASVACLLIPVLLLVALSGWGSPGGNISGTVADPSEAVMPGVTVVICNTETGMRQTTTTNSDGFFSLSALPPGEYQIEAHQSGFRPAVRSGLILETGKALEIDLKLELGEQSTAVEVSESGLHVDTTDTTMGETITTTKMASVPLNGRSFTDLLALQAGVVPAARDSRTLSSCPDARARLLPVTSMPATFRSVDSGKQIMASSSMEVPSKKTLAWARHSSRILTPSRISAC